MTGALVMLVATSTVGQYRYRFAAKPDAWLAPSCVALGAGSLAIDRVGSPLTSDELASLDRADVPAIDRPATYFWSPELSTASDIAFIGAILAPLVILTEFSGNYTELLAMYSETMILAGSLTTLGKAIGRVRPFAYNENVPMEMRLSRDATRSFPSGHSTITMAAGVFLAGVYDTYRPGSKTAKTLWWVGPGLGMVTGSLRVLSGWHFPTDVATGLVVGATLGYAVPRLHRVKAPTGPVVVPTSSPPIRLAFRISL